MKDKYEISLWEDYLVPTIGEVESHYEEKKIAVIGSNTMTALCKALEPKLIENINGTNIFTFKMYYTYNDGKVFKNPFLNLLINERKIKVLWKNKWYDFIIKNCQENSVDKSIIYTCQDLYVNELSKNGFNLEFDSNLENNQGNVLELGAAVLEGTDWTIDVENSETIQQKMEEPVYEINVINSFITKEGKTFLPGDLILLFYSCFQAKKEDCQFFYTTNYASAQDSQLLTDGKCYTINLTSWLETEETINTKVVKVWYAYSGENPVFKVYEESRVSDKYRAERLVLSQKRILDPINDKYVGLYLLNNDQTIYGYSQTVYEDPTIVNNLITNGKEFASTTGWIGPNMQFSLYPKFTGTNVANYSAKSYLKVGASSYFNKGIQESSIYIKDGFQKGQTYIFRFKAMTEVAGAPSGTYVTNGITPAICDYTNNNGVLTKQIGSDYMTYEKLTGSTNNWVEWRLTCTKPATKREILVNNMGLFLTSIGNYWIEQTELFVEVWGEGTINVPESLIRINPGDMDKYSLAKTEYRYYYPNQNTTAEEDLDYVYIGFIEKGGLDLKPVYNTNYEKIRNITEKNSNRFNLIQTLAETFECWAKFSIQHDEETGKILYTNGKPNKKISFINEVGQNTGIGFVYGIDLKGISRSINSDKITTRVIVTPNNNEFAENGFCTIARSKENYSRDTSIFNFDYYISQGLIDGGELNKDLYLSTPDSMGYYYYLNKWNLDYDRLSEEAIAKRDELLKQQSLLVVYQEYATSLAEEITSITSEIIALASVSTIDQAATYIKNNPNDKKVISLMANLTNLKNSQTLYTNQKNSLTTSVNNLVEYVDILTTDLEDLNSSIESKNLDFYNKYSRFIQEGSWTSEKYIDADLYYLDALDIAYTSSRPQISYDISVVRLSAIKEFKNRVFKLGDISFIQDTEFFGYTYIDQIKTPYKEKVLISEVTSWFDSPEKDAFVIQNYKTQFEDLFQRITSTTQSLQYASGKYQRAASGFVDGGTINPETLQNSILLNQELVFSAQNDTFYQDSTGITLTDASNPNKKTKVTSGGLFITTDSGKTWKNAIRGEGISTQYLTAGSINVSNISLMDGDFTNFRWDKKGINAFYKGEYGVNLSKFVRFDHFGIYGVNSESGADYTPVTEEDIWRDATFGMTWKGFFIKNKYAAGYVSVDSIDDIVVSDGAHNRIKIGNIGTLQAPVFGIRISDATGAPVMETVDDGSLWLKKRLNVQVNNGANSVGIGTLDTIDATHGRQVINATNKFIVYEDGSMRATGGFFEGEINATSGQIGGMTIAEIESTGYRTAITTDSGIIFKNNSGAITLIAHLYKNEEEILSGLTYKWEKNGITIPGATARTLTVFAPETTELQTAVYGCEIQLS